MTSKLKVLDVRAISAEPGCPNVLKLHFAESVRDEDRTDLLEAINLYRRTPPLNTGEAETSAGAELDLRHNAFDQLAEAAAQSSWVPPEYMANDWLSDCAHFLRTGEGTALTSTRPNTGEEVERLRQAARHVLEWWPEGSENSRQGAAMSSAWGDDLRALRAALQQEPKQHG